MTWRIIDHEGNVLQSGFQYKTDAQEWITKLCRYFKIEEDN